MLVSKKTVSEYSEKVKKLVSQLKIKNYKMDIKGSYSTNNQIYYGDYDFTTDLQKKNPEITFQDFEKVMEKTFSDHDNYFMEIKYQTKNDKYKYFTIEEFYKSKTQFDKIKDKLYLVKLDFITFDGYSFKECSCNYEFFKEEENDLIANSKELEKEGKHYKALKRKLLQFSINNESEKIKDLIKFFNSEIGKKYDKYTNLVSIKLLLGSEMYQKVYSENEKKQINKRVLFVLNEFNINPNLKMLNKEINKLDKEINKEAKEINSKY